MLDQYTNKQILRAIESLGIESLLGVSYAEEGEILEFLDLLNEHELAEIALAIK